MTRQSTVIDMNYQYRQCSSILIWLFSNFYLIRANGPSALYKVTPNVEGSSIQTLSPYRIEEIERRLDCVNSCNLDRFTCRSVIFDSDGDQCLHFSDKQEGAFSVASNNALTNLTYFEVPVDCGWASDDEECCYPAKTDCFDWNLLPLYSDCQDAFTNGERDSGSTYFIKPTNTSRITKAVCQFDATSGWTVIQSRMDGSVDFFRYYDEYVEGFGNMSADYWIGLDSIYDLTKNNRKLSIYLEDHAGQVRTANYSTFYIDGGEDFYLSHIAGYSGNAGDALSERHNNQVFSTRDMGARSSCANNYHGGWWYGSPCHASNLNGVWYEGGTFTQFAIGATWTGWYDQYYSYKTIYMRLSH